MFHDPLHKMATTFFRILKFGFQNFSRNALLSAATIAVLILALLMFNGLVFFGVVANSAIASLQDKIDISVYFKSSAPEDEILKLERALESLSEVRAVEYVSQDKALTIFKERHQKDETISQALAELQVNPLLASLNIKAKAPEHYSTIASYLESDDLKPLVEKVSYGQNKLVIDRLASIIDTVKNAGLGITLFLVLVAVLVIFNTVRLVIYSNREEIGIMRLVGAANKFINGPYIVAGMLYGLLAGLVSLALSIPIVALAGPYVSIFMPEISLSAYLFGHLPQLVVYQLVFGMGLGAVSAVLAVRRYLKI